MSSNPEAKSPTLKDNGVHFLCGPFVDDTARTVIPWILEANYASKREYDHLTLIINSPGGDVSAAFAIIDVMKGSAIPVHTVGLGLVGSAGLLTFIAGAHRTLTPNTSILSHQWSWGSYGKSHELFARVKEFDLTEARMIEHYSRCTGLSEKKIKKKLMPPQDVWLSAEEALKLNLCDAVKDVR